MNYSLQKKILCAILCMVFAGVLCGCSKKEDAVSQKEKNVFPEKVNRIAVNGTSLASVVLMLGAGEKIVAALPSVQNNPWFRKVCPSIQNAASAFSGSLSPETLLRTKPDIAILWSQNQRVSERLQILGIPVVNVHYQNSDEFREAVFHLARVLGNSEFQNAKCFFHYYDSLETLVRDRTARLSQNEKKSVYYAADNPTNTEGPASSINTWIFAIGAVNAAQDCPQAAVRVDIDAETLIRWNPDVIIVRDFQTKESFLENPQWQKLKAVQKGDVYLNPKGVNSWATRSGESALQFLWAAKTLYPERFEDINLIREVSYFYRTFYQYAPDLEEIEGILQPRRSHELS